MLSVPALSVKQDEVQAYHCFADRLVNPSEVSLDDVLEVFRMPLPPLTSQWHRIPFHCP
jgi:hypothetical protein